ncbi:MAG: ABC transporter substrate-binding protein [Anaerolineae bacterium]|nr:ABC transporter substrate-binding protein [Anaerolineae bacterium]
MKALRIVILLSFVTLIAAISLPQPAQAQSGQWPRTIIDAAGQPVTLDAPPTRIASVTIASDEILLSLLEPERLIGVTTLADDPGISNVASRAALVPHRLTADPELLISLEPDLIIVASWTDPAVVQQLRDAGLTVFLMPAPVGLEPIAEAVRMLGELVGEEAEAEALVTAMQAQIAAVSEAVAGVEPVQVLFLTPGNYTSGTPSTIAEVIAAAGGIDIAAEAGASQYDPLGDEFILEQDPDVILLTGWTPWDPGFAETFRQNPAYADLQAVRTNRVYVVNDAHLSTTSHFIAEGVADVAAFLYPDRYPAYPLTVTDALGQQVTLPARPEAIVSLTLGTDELLAALLADEPGRVAALSHLADASGISNLAATALLTAFTPTRVEADPEQIIALEPDLVLAATFTDEAVRQQLTAAGIPVIAVGDFTSVPAMLDNITWLGQVLGVRATAQRLVGDLTDRLEAIAGQTAILEQRKSLIYLATDNWIAGCQTTLDDMISRAGGVNAACAAGLDGWKQVDAETLLTLDPEVIVLSSWVDITAWQADPAVQGLTAVREGRVSVGNDAHLSAVSHYIVDGVEDLFAILYPELAGS